MSACPCPSPPLSFTGTSLRRRIPSLVAVWSDPPITAAAPSAAVDRRRGGCRRRAPGLSLVDNNEYADDLENAREAAKKMAFHILSSDLIPSITSN
ncbi:hypothetical protein L1987_55528 [Smallanthus sonchifolius]|uniref:Uncharacterized protein n=1 Tax=Smallanthus sonchifolius TaxID=185202 RepID=A0ACB9EA82_9ASTR|nr:hypothetical protein L1987_55528 [Smallanthus sonchifolius]